MAEYICLMHDDAIADDKAWEPYVRKLQQGGFFQGGSAIGDGLCVREGGHACFGDGASDWVHPGGCR